MKSESDIRDLWTAFARTHTGHLLNAQPPAAHESRAKTHDEISAHYNALHDLQSVLGQRINWLTPIYLLPDEILMRIFVFVWVARSPNAPPPVDLMTVSRRWLSIINSFRRIWAYPSLCTYRAKMDSLLSRSKYSVLHLNWRFPQTYGSHLGFEDDDSLLSPLLARSRTIALQASTSDSWEFGTNTSAPLLESLEVVVMTPPSNMTAALWPNQVFDTPWLHHLDLSNFCYLDWSHPFLCPMLTSLKTSFHDNDWIFTDEDWLQSPEAAPCGYNGLLDALERLPYLTHVNLMRCVSTSLHLGSTRDERRKIDMTHLRVLTVYDSSQACATLSGNLIIPENAEALYVFNWTGEVDAENLPALGAHSPAIWKHTRLLITVIDGPRRGRGIGFTFVDEFRNGSVVISANVIPPLGADVEELAPEAGATWHYPICATIVSALPIAHVRQIDVDMDEHISPLPRSFWLRSLSHARKVEAISIGACTVLGLSSALRHNS